MSGVRVVMKRMVVILAVALMGGSAALAAPASPSTRPAAAPRGVEDARPRVLVLPFEELAEGPSRPWVGKAMQQSLVAELTRGGLVSVMTPAADAPPATDAAAAAKLARDVHAPLVIIGSYQLIEQELRVTGQMLESINGESIAGINATGSLRDLFGIQDVIAAQVRRDLQVILQPSPVAGAKGRSQGPVARDSSDPFEVRPSGPVQAQQPTGAYSGSDLQRSLGDEWTPPASPEIEQARDRNRYNYPTAPYYPSYDYYDWCGYSWPHTSRRSYPAGYNVVPPGPGPTRTDFPQNNYNTQPGQMGRPSGGNYNNPPGQMGRPGGNTNFNNPPGQSGRSSGGNQIGSPGQSGRTSSSSSGSAGQSRRIPFSSANASRP